MAIYTYLTESLLSPSNIDIPNELNRHYHWASRISALRFGSQINQKTQGKPCARA